MTSQISSIWLWALCLAMHVRDCPAALSVSSGNGRDVIPTVLEALLLHGSCAHADCVV